MGKINKVMVAVASSDHTAGIFNYAADLADQTDAVLIVVSIINSRDVQAVSRIASMGYDVDGEHYVQGVREERRMTLDGVIKKSGFPADRVKIIFRTGNPLEELLKITIEEEVDMVVMGIKGASDLKQVIVGSVAEKFFRRCPVTVVSYRDVSQAKRLKKRILKTH